MILLRPLGYGGHVSPPPRLRRRAVERFNRRTLFFFNFGDAAQAKLATTAKVERNLDPQDGAEALRSKLHRNAEANLKMIR